MRSPSLHIFEKDLVKIFKQLDIYDVNMSYKKLAHEILLHSKKYSLTKRIILINNEKLKKKTGRLVLSEIKSAAYFSKLAYLIRKQKKHRGINITKVGSRDWINVKEVTKLAIDFCNDFDLGIEKGFKIYIDIGLNKMKKFSWLKFNNLHQSISIEYESRLEIEDDESPKETKQACDVYERILLEGSGITFNYITLPEKYKYFIEVKKIVKNLGISINDYIKAQFAALEWVGAIPDPSQLVGDKAISRVQDYLMKNKPKSKEKEFDWRKIKKA